jgi:hypothetical protein
VTTDEPDRRLELLHENVKKYGTVFNTVAPDTVLEGVLRRMCITTRTRCCGRRTRAAAKIRTRP